MNPFFVHVITTPKDDPSVIQDDRFINYNRPAARSWLAKHCMWALLNGYAVHTAAKD